ncbi:class I SAM-dependent methyltransferase [Afifella sp. IM 167]|uniref:class I SAM-dependent DNA methyltransferase n=1 Tax=Afifella sp. IM 167 TaxID=2033586 RepID=UPI001CCBE87F|nr:class I SAM-dependent methyltransferase [Afifella sp. IM 167]MBZ8132979.1 SAM-dependent methyltransferase [Afifella sp. IM 167]
MADNPLLRRVYALGGDLEETRSVYADWAKSYDEDTTQGMGYVAPAIAAAALADRVGPQAHILDAGCGTGLVGEELKRRGVSRIDGIDLSEGMLDVAAGKEVYSSLSVADMTQPLDIAPDSYDAAISVGVFTSGHVGPEAIADLARVVKPQAPIVLTVHEDVWDKDGYAAHLQAMEAAGTLRINGLVEAPYHRKEGYSCRLCLLAAA